MNATTKKRKLKIYEGNGCSRNPIPKVVLQGAWLKVYGFAIGDCITVECYRNKLVITNGENIE